MISTINFSTAKIQVKKWFEAIVKDKFVKRGWFWDNYYVVLEIQGRINKQHVNENSYYKFPEIGQKTRIALYQHGDGFWYPEAEVLG